MPNSKEMARRTAEAIGSACALASSSIEQRIADSPSRLHGNAPTLDYCGRLDGTIEGTLAYLGMSSTAAQYAISRWETNAAQLPRTRDEAFLPRPNAEEIPAHPGVQYGSWRIPLVERTVAAAAYFTEAQRLLKTPEAARAAFNRAIAVIANHLAWEAPPREYSLAEDHLRVQQGLPSSYLSPAGIQWQNRRFYHQPQEKNGRAGILNRLKALTDQVVANTGFSLTEDQARIFDPKQYLRPEPSRSYTWETRTTNEHSREAGLDDGF